MDDLFQQLLQNIKIANGHQCRDGKPTHTINYALTGKGKNLAKFKGTAKTEQILEAEGSSQERPYVVLAIIHPQEDDASTVRQFVCFQKSFQKISQRFMSLHFTE